MRAQTWNAATKCVPLCTPPNAKRTVLSEKRPVAGARRRSVVEVIGFEPTAPSLRSKCP
jgi:hypothetical protein